MEYRILGPLEVSTGAELLSLGPQKQRALLAILLLDRGRTVSRDRLIDDLWGDEVPSSAPKAIQNFVSRLRKLLPPNTIVTRPPGYAVEAGSGQLDLERFGQLLNAGRESLGAGEPRVASELFREALSLWRGPALAEFCPAPFAEREGPRLEELRLEALERWLESELAVGHHSEVVGELESLVGRYPLREGLRRQLMVALYRSHRQAEALSVYQDARRRLVDELGIEPSATLQDLERAILRQDASLALDAGTSAAAAPAQRGEHPLVPADDRSQVRSSREPAAPNRLLRGAETFVGREAETARLQVALRDALDGQGQLVMLVGEPGIGKTRTAAEVAVAAEQLGASAFWGRCRESEGAPPYWPWVEALRSYVRECDPERLRSELGAGVAELAQVIPDVHERLPGLTTSLQVGDPKQARFRLFDSFTTFLRRATQNGPLVLVLDDLHWADNDSLALLEFVSAEIAGMQLLVIGTYRDVDMSRHHPLSGTLAELTRQQRAERIHLRGLNQEEVARCIEAISAIAPSAALAEAVHMRTEGNPLFVTEVVRLMAQEGELTSERLRSTRQPVPEGIRDVIRKRLARLSERCNAMLTIAALVGREFEARQLDRLVGDLSDDQLLQLFEEALAERLIEELPPAVNRYQFTHALIQETVADELSLTRRARLHGRIAETLEALYGAEAEAHAPELASHFEAAATVLGSDKFVQYATIAAEQALVAHAPEQALAYFERALGAIDGEAGDVHAAALRFGLGRAQLAVLERHELQHAARTMRHAFDDYVAAGDLTRAVAVAAHPLSLSIGIGATEIPQMIEEALTLVPDDSHAAGRLLATHGWFVGIAEGDGERADTAFEQALEIAQRYDDLALERRTLANAAWVDVWHFRWRDGISKGLEAIELARRDADEHTEILALRCLVWAHTAAGEREQARSHSVQSLAVAEKLRERWWLASASFDSARLSHYEGDWQAARQMSAVSLNAEPWDPRPLSIQAALDYELGDFDVGAASLGRLENAAERFPPPGPIAEHYFAAGLIPLICRITGTDEGIQKAKAGARSLLAMPRVAPALAMTARSGLALVAERDGDVRTAEELYADLEPQRGTASFFIPFTVDRLLGSLARTAGRRDTAVVHFEEGLAFCERAGYRPEYAWTASDYAEALLERGSRADQEHAGRLQRNAIEIAGELGMHPLMKRVRSRGNLTEVKREDGERPG